MDDGQRDDSGKLSKAELLASLQDPSKSIEYASARNELLADEKQSAWDAPARSRASRTELEAARIIRRICEDERVGPLFGDLPGESEPDTTTRDMGGRFLRNRDRIQRSKIFQAALRAPKGAHLHLHFNSELPPEELLQFARNNTELRDTLVIRATLPLRSAEAFQQCEVVFNVLQKDKPTGNLFSKTYQPDIKIAESRVWMRWSDFRQQLPAHVEALQTTICTEDPEPEDIIDLDLAESWVREKMIITQRLKYERASTHNHMWACFNQGTRAFKGLLNYESVYRWYIGHMIQSMIDQRVMYAELRPMLLDKTIPSDDGTRQLNHKEQMDIIVEEVRRMQSELKAVGQLDKFPFGLKIIYCAPRSIAKPRMENELADCIKLKLQHPDLICGTYRP